MADIEIVGLRSCPFCSGEAILSEFRTPLHYWQVECGREECSTDGPARRTEAEAITAWNTRDPIITEMVEALEGLAAEFRKFSRYGSPIAMQANEAMQRADAVLAKVRGK